ncbi:MAG: hypothetical protein LIO92_08765 [Clostridiales bacterium]|nr:hypothetical protein [Clostridiales bacterium]
MSTSLQQLELMYRRIRAELAVMLVLLIGALILFFVERRLTLVVLAAAVACQFLLVRPQQKRYTSALTKSNLEQTVCRYLNADSLLEKANSRLTPTALRRAGLMPFREEQGTPLLRWEIHGYSDDLRLTLCDATFAQDFKLQKKGKKRVHFNSGVWVHIALPSDCGKRFFLYDETSVPTPIRMDFFARQPAFETALIPDQELSERFVLYRPAKDESSEPPRSLLRSLKKLAQYTPGYIALGVNGDKLDIFIRNRFLAMPVSVSRKPTQQMLDFDPLPELSYMVDIAKSIH